MAPQNHRHSSELLTILGASHLTLNILIGEMPVRNDQTVRGFKVEPLESPDWRDDLLGL